MRQPGLPIAVLAPATSPEEREERRLMGRSRTSWIRWYWSHFDGGTKVFSCSEVGQYLRLLHLQWDSGSEQKIPKDIKVLTRLLGERPTRRVLAKFTDADEDSLRNQRAAEELWKAKREYDAKSAGGKKGRGLQDTPGDTRQVSLEDTPGDTQGHSGRHSTRDASGKGILNEESEYDLDVDVESEGEQKTRTTDNGHTGDDADACPDCGGTEPECLRCHPPTDLELFTKVFVEAYDRKMKVAPKLSGSSQKHFRGLLKLYGREAVCCLPLLARSDDAQKDAVDRESGRVVKKGRGDTRVCGTRSSAGWSTT